MLAVAEALKIVLAKCRALPSIDAPLTAVHGLVLAEDVASDLDMPPFDKALMDGYAVRCADLHDGAAILPVQAEVMAGTMPPALLPGHAIRIMTGAPIPAGADAVIRVEDTNMAADRVEIRAKPPKPGQFILTKGREMRRGDVVLTAGAELRPQEIGTLATIGRSNVRAIPAPAVSVLATGDELVEANQMPGPSQLRNSNGPMLSAQAKRAGAVPRDLGIGRDDEAALRALVNDGLKSQILVLSGGVSAGKKDLVPEVLKSWGVEPHFHHVAMKPGKPLFFGTRGDTLVFGLPGNPVSSFCGFELFVRPAIRKLAGRANPGPVWQEAVLAESFTHSSDRPTYHPAMVENCTGLNEVRTVPWFGSPDLRALAKANALVLLPAGSHSFAAGQRLPVLSLD